MADPQRTMTFIGHLEELRNRLIICIAVWVLTTTFGFFLPAA
jgi:Sec-independent protein secretion pathway component TatC